MTYLISRVAKKNPDINGRTLYLTNIGLWTLNRDEAARFHKARATVLCDDEDLKMEPAT